jgi:hypothetical protein
VEIYFAKIFLPQSLFRVRASDGFLAMHQICNPRCYSERKEAWQLASDKQGISLKAIGSLPVAFCFCLKFKCCNGSDNHGGRSNASKPDVAFPAYEPV